MAARFVSNCLKIEELCLGVFKSRGGKAEDLFNDMAVILNRVGLHKDNLRAQGYDGCNTMAGQHTGLAAWVRIEYGDHILFLRCQAHNVALMVKDVIKSSIPSTEILTELLCYLKGSASRKRTILDCVPLEEELKLIFDEADLVCPEPMVNDMLSLGTLSATRWTTRADFVGNFLAAYGQIVRACLAMSEKKYLAGAKARGYADKLMRFDITNTSLQKVEITVVDREEHIAKLKSAILSQSHKFDIFNTAVRQGANLSGIDEPQLPTRLHRARSVLCIDEYFEGKFDEVYNLILTSMEKRVENQLLHDISIILNQQLISTDGEDADNMGLLFEVNKRQLKCEVSAVIAKHFPEDIDIHLLTNEIDDYVRRNRECTLMELITMFRTSAVMRRDMPTTMLLCRLIMLIPFTTSTVERQFSGMRRIRNYLRASQTQHRMNDLIALTLNYDITAQISPEFIAARFCIENQARRNIFECKRMHMALK